ncbi:hypothetical protein GCM10025790_00050 [Nesterenkonia rhizosphaerae]|uniref:Alpha-L-glutamate ligase-related protein ATP-grasp domain-containing protein n=1 Tax=Nesterenkonia rhizosphaerae TaxID=1348272 RepID=A0ABP9FN49_9MICC
MGSNSELAAKVADYGHALTERITPLSKGSKLASSQASLSQLTGLVSVAAPRPIKYPAVVRDLDIPVGEAISFYGELMLRGIAACESRGKYTPLVLNDKRRAYEFVDSLGVRRPLSWAPLPLSRILLQENVVIKPTNGAGSKGCYLALGSECWRYIKNGGIFEGEASLRGHMKSLMNSNLNK